jgi:hypothetical protein
VTQRQKRIVHDFERLVARARLAELLVVVDSDATVIRLITALQASSPGADLRVLGEKIRVHNACGGGAPKSSGLACNYGNL